jgi:hypothetical protein
MGFVPAEAVGSRVDILSKISHRKNHIRNRYEMSHFTEQLLSLVA